MTLVAGKQQAEVDIANLSTQQITDTYATNVFSLIWLVKAALPHMQPGSSIITTNSIQAEQPSSFLVDYAGTKAAIKNMTMSLAKQLANRGIRVNSVAPGPIGHLCRLLVDSYRRTFQHLANRHPSVELVNRQN